MFFIFSCKKKDDYIQPLSGKTSQNWAKIDINDYRKAFSDSANQNIFFSAIKNQNEFVSIKEYKGGIKNFRYEGEALAIKDSIQLPDVLEKLLNPDGVFQVNNYLIRLDKKREKVYVLDTTNINLYSEFVSNNIKNKNIFIFSTEENVLSYLGNPELMKNHNSNAKIEFWGWFCRDRAVPAASSNRTQTLWGNLSITHGVEYKTFGFYFELSTFFRYEGFEGQTNFQAADYTSFARHASRCNNAGSSSGSNTFQTNAFSSHRHVFYGNVESLRSFYIEATFSVAPWGYFPAKQIVTR